MFTKPYYQLGLIGWPLEHSISPLLHSAFLDAAGLAGKYNLFPIAPDDNKYNQFEILLTRLRHREIQGLNVTIPHKQSVIPYLDRLTLQASDIGAVNTIYLVNGELVGDNTDASGFMADLIKFLNGSHSINHLKSKSALILGAGGSASAVAYALSRADWQVTITARRLEQAQSLAAELSHSDEYPLTHIPFTPMDLSQQSPHLIVNTTPVGMYPNLDASPWPEAVALPPHANLYDLVYNPQETRFVQIGRASGLSASSGLGMLIEQAALAFYCWTSVNITDEIKQDVNNIASESMSIT
jgi:shikimate dehydrogenase